MRRIIYVLIITVACLIIIGCCSKKEISNNNVLGASMKYELILKNANQFQVDSLIKADTLPLLNYWLTGVFVDYNTNERITKKTYIKNYSKNHEIVYVITGTKEPYYVTKRIKK